MPGPDTVMPTELRPTCWRRDDGRSIGLFADTDFKDNWIIGHDALSVWWEKENLQYREKRLRAQEDRW